MRKRVLIVDDEEILRTSLMQFLEDFAYEVEGADSGARALAMLADGAQFDVAVVDVRMPGMSGEDFILRAHAIHPGLKFIIQTGTLDYEIGADLQLIGMGPENLLKKPVLKLDMYVDAVEKVTG